MDWYNHKKGDSRSRSVIIRKERKKTQQRQNIREYDRKKIGEQKILNLKFKLGQSNMSFETQWHHRPDYCLHHPSAGPHWRRFSILVTQAIRGWTRVRGWKLQGWQTREIDVRWQNLSPTQQQTCLLPRAPSGKGLREKLIQSPISFSCAETTHFKEPPD